MKFGSNKSALNFLKNGCPSVDVPIYKGEPLDVIDNEYSKIAANVFIETFEQYRGMLNICKKEYWTKPFFNAYIKAKKSIADALTKENLKPEEGNHSGILINNMEGEHITFYSFDLVHGKKELNQHGVKIFNIYISVFRDHMLHILIISKINFTYISPGFRSHTHDEIIGDILQMELFKKYCDIEIKIVNSGSKIKDINCKYINNTNSNIQILDSTWFTTLVNSAEFNVRGHFRLQPFGKGLLQRKLIWIDEFKKSGYVREFKRPVNIDLN